MKYAYHKNSTATAESRRKTSRTRAGRNILFPLAALLLCATACQKEGGRGTLTATIEPYESNAKTYIDADHYACWEDGDEVRINGTAYGISTGGQPGRASINTGGSSPEGDLTAFYPADMISSDMTTVTLPPVQKYEVRNGRQVIQSPMAAYCAADGTNLPFHNLGALLQVTLPATTGSTVLSISVKGNRGQQMCGTAELRIKEGQPQLSTFRVGCDSVILSDINQELTTARSYYIVVPAYTSFAEMTIHVVLKQSDGSVSVHHKSDDTFGKTLDRNHIGAFGYNLDGIVSTYPATRVLLYTTTDNTHVTPAGLPNIDYQTYGMIALNADMTEIGADAFRNLTNLASVTLPKGVTTISFHAFQECTSLTSVTLPENLRTISNSVFQECTSLQTITLPEGVTGIGNSVFYGCTSLQSVTLPESLETMANYVFQGCTSLQTITLPSTLTALGQSVFEGSGLTSITIPSSVTEIKSSTFKDCTSLTSVALPEGVDDNMGFCIPRLHQPHLRRVARWVDGNMGFCIPRLHQPHLRRAAAVGDIVRLVGIRRLRPHHHHHSGRNDSDTRQNIQGLRPPDRSHPAAIHGWPTDNRWRLQNVRKLHCLSPHLRAGRKRNHIQSGKLLE